MQVFKCRGARSCNSYQSNRLELQKTSFRLTSGQLQRRRTIFRLAEISTQRAVLQQKCNSAAGEAYHGSLSVHGDDQAGNMYSAYVQLSGTLSCLVQMLHVLKIEKICQ